MKRKEEKKPQPKPLEVGDMVLTPISDRPAKIIAITEKAEPSTRYAIMSTSGEVTFCNTVKKFTVRITFPALRAERFHDVIADFRESQLTRIEAA